MCIKRSAVSLAVAAVLIAGWANVALGQSSVTIPPSSIANPSDAGVRLHTNVQVRSFTTRSQQPNGGPPYAGYFYEDPASLACIYDLISTFDEACHPNDPSLNNPTGGSRAV